LFSQTAFNLTNIAI